MEFGLKELWSVKISEANKAIKVTSMDYGDVDGDGHEEIPMIVEGSVYLKVFKPELTSTANLKGRINPIALAKFARAVLGGKTINQIPGFEIVYSVMVLILQMCIWRIFK